MSSKPHHYYNGWLANSREAFVSSCPMFPIAAALARVGPSDKSCDRPAAMPGAASSARSRAEFSRISPSADLSATSPSPRYPSQILSRFFPTPHRLAAPANLASTKQATPAPDISDSSRNPQCRLARFARAPAIPRPNKAIPPAARPGAPDQVPQALVSNPRAPPPSKHFRQILAQFFVVHPEHLRSASAAAFGFVALFAFRFAFLPLLISASFS